MNRKENNNMEPNLIKNVEEREENNMKVMISQGMNGRKTEDIENERNQIKEKLNKMEIDVVDTLFDFEPSNCINGSLYYLSKSIEAMSNVNAIIFVGDWQNYRGCRIEHQIAKSYGIKILYEDFFINEKENVYRHLDSKLYTREQIKESDE